VPGASLGFHTDPTKSTQFAPQVAGGGGRNINYLIDGGDNNDDTSADWSRASRWTRSASSTSRPALRADTGRANGGTIKVVTKGGTNEFRGSGSSCSGTSPQREEPHRGDQQPARATIEAPVRASLGGPIIKDRPTSSPRSSASSRTPPRP